jgi:hypothetical protein
MPTIEMYSICACCFAKESFLAEAGFLLVIVALWKRHLSSWPRTEHGISLSATEAILMAHGQ